MSTLRAGTRRALQTISQLPSLPLPAALRYSAAPVLVALGALLQQALLPPPSQASFLFLGISLGLATALGGRGPGLVAVGLSALVGNFFFLEPIGAPTLSGPGLVSTLAFLPVGVIVAWLAGSFRTANLRAAEVSAALRQSEERCRTALDCMPEPVAIHDSEGRFEYLNAPMAALLGQPRAAILGKRREELCPGQMAEEFQGPMQRAYASGQRQSFTYRSQPGLLPRIHVKIDLVPIFDVGRRVGQLLEVAWDLTERTLAEEALRRSETILEQAGEMAHLGAWSVDLSDPDDLAANALRWSPEVYRIFGYEPGVVKQGLAFLLERTHPDDRELAMAAFTRSMREKSLYRLDHRIVRPDGSERIVSEHGRWDFDEQGRAIRILGAVQDITEQRRGEEALREADRRKDEFLGMLSHELRNPLAPIRNSAYLLAKDHSLGERSRRAVEIIERQSSHLARLVDDLLDLTRIVRGKTRLQRASLDLGELLRRAAEDYQSLLQAHELVLRLPAEEVRVDGDATRLSQVIGNLLANSAKFTPEGGRIAVSLARTDGRAVLEVRDDGMGIDAETLARLFQPFAQADRSLDRSKGGLGLGLALVKGLVEMHGGTVQARSDGLGRGASFTVTLPLEQLEGAGPRSAATAPGSRGRRVLIVEDNRDAAESLCSALESWGHQVAVARDGAEGIARARELRPEVVLCDLGMPGELDGYAVARALRQDPATAGGLLLAVSGYAQPEDLRLAREAGFDSHLAKPPDLTALERLLALD